MQPRNLLKYLLKIRKALPGSTAGRPAPVGQNDAC